MDVACEHCQSKFKIPDEKVPKDQAFSITCPKCKKKFSVDPRGGAAKAKAEPKPAASTSTQSSGAAGAYDAADRPFDFLEEGAETALLCEPDAAVREQMAQRLKSMGYYLTSPENSRAVLKQMRYHLFDVIVLNEMFDTRNPDQNNVLRYLERLSMEDRRNMFVVLITDRFRTMDNMAAFHNSVNIVINRENLNDFEKILKKAVAENAAFYKVYRDAMVKAGRA
jgi:predicted Zn finger-like uncharacterized protein